MERNVFRCFAAEHFDLSDDWQCEKLEHGSEVVAARDFGAWFAFRSLRNVGNMRDPRR
jgi:hypothetical protein